jgi:hypothetical protein
MRNGESVQNSEMTPKPENGESKNGFQNLKMKRASKARK